MKQGRTLSSYWSDVPSKHNISVRDSLRTASTATERVAGVGKCDIADKTRYCVDYVCPPLYMEGGELQARNTSIFRILPQDFRM